MKNKPTPIYIKNAHTLALTARILAKKKPKLKKPILTRWQVRLLQFED